jgi:DNA polymerase alpha subunit A
VNTNATVLSDALRISYELKKAVNDRYKLLEIDLDGIFQRLLLLQKKKYAAVKVNEGSKTTSIEIKGLDMKRREYSALSKNVSQCVSFLIPIPLTKGEIGRFLTHPCGRDRYVLDQILSGEATEIVVENIHEYLRSVGENIRSGRMKLEDFVIFKVSTWPFYPIETCGRYLNSSAAFGEESGRLPGCEESAPRASRIEN